MEGFGPYRVIRVPRSTRARVSPYRVRDYHRLEIWRRAHALAIAIHDVARGLRGNEFSGLRSLLTRAADSIAATIVEGCGVPIARDRRALNEHRRRRL